MTPTERLLHWHAKWKISEDIFVCRTCHAEQRETGFDFVHVSGCREAALGVQPWQALAQVRDSFAS